MTTKKQIETAIAAYLNALELDKSLNPYFLVGYLHLNGEKIEKYREELKRTGYVL